MIATILPSSTAFHAVDYNERKVSEGVAELLEMKNFDFIGQLQSYTPEQLKQFLTDYSQRNAYSRVLSSTSPSPAEVTNTPMRNC